MFKIMPIFGRNKIYTLILNNDNNENSKSNDVENFNKINKFNSKSFFPIENLQNKLNETPLKLTLSSINLPKSVLEVLVSSKGIIIKEMKNFIMK